MVVGRCDAFIFLFFSLVGRCRLVFRKKLYSRVIFQFIFCAFALSGGSCAVATGSGSAWPGTCAVAVSALGKVGDNTVFHGGPALRLSVLA